MVHNFDSLATGKILNKKNLYIAHGNEDTYEDSFKIGSDKIDSILRERNIPGLKWQFKSMDNDSHGTTAIEGIPKGLIALYREFTIPDKLMDKFYQDKQTPYIENVKKYYYAASIWSGLKLPLVDDLNNMGYNCYYAGKNAESLEIFKWGLTLYPDNINLYDSMGEIQNETGNKKAALNYYVKGLILVKQQKKQLENKKYISLVHSFESKIKNFKP